MNDLQFFGPDRIIAFTITPDKRMHIEIVRAVKSRTHRESTTLPLESLIALRDFLNTQITTLQQ